MTPELRAARAAAVRGLLADQNIQDAFASVEADLMTEWKNCHDAAGRENIWRAVKIVERVKAWMLSAASADMTALRRVK